MRMLTRLAALPAIALAAGQPAHAEARDGWPLLDSARSGNCEIALIGNGKIMDVRASGLIPGERLTFRLFNGDMKPVEWMVLADRNGNWNHLYMPFRSNHPGALVEMRLDGASCGLGVAAPFERGIRVIP